MKVTSFHNPAKLAPVSRPEATNYLQHPKDIKEEFLSQFFNKKG
jgi:hypothetical protein